MPADTGGTLPGAGLVPAAGRNRGGPSPAGAGECRTDPEGPASGQAEASARAGSTSVQAARSAERVTASSTSWT